MTISPEAKEAAAILRSPCLSPLSEELVEHYVQLAINSAIAPLQEKITELQGDISTLKHVLRFEQEKEKNYSKRIAEAHSDLVKTVEQRDLAYQQIERLRSEVKKSYDEGYKSYHDPSFRWDVSHAKRVVEGKE